MTKFAITMNDGSVALMQVVGDSTPEAEIGRWPEKERARVVSVSPIDDANIPTDRTFRSAWTLSSGRIDHDMDKARRIHMGRIRRIRNARLGRLDTETTIAIGKGDVAAVAAIETRKQLLRDVPQKYDVALSAATTPDDLKAIWPAELAQ